MSVKMDKFLNQFFMQVYFNRMPSEQFATFTNYIKSGDDFTGDMKIWKERLVHQDANGKWVENDLPSGLPAPTGSAPNEWELSDEEWKKLYLEIRDAFIQMDANRSKFSDQNDKDTYNENALNFLNDYFGDSRDKPFSNVPATDAAEQQISTELLPLLTNNATTLKILLEEWHIIDSEFTYDKLTKAISSKDYNKKSDIRDKVIRLAEHITAYTKQDSYYYDENLVKQIGTNDFTQIKEGFKTGFDDVRDAAQLQKFKDCHKDILQIIAQNKKVRDQFNAPKINEQLQDAQKKTNYNDPNSANFLVNTHADQLTPMQRLDKWAKSTYSNVFEKYKLLQGDRLYYSPQAAAIVAALDGAGVKPTGGLDAIVGSGIKAKLAEKSASAAAQFDWMTKTLEDIKKTIPKAYAGALSNGSQLQHVITELIVRAVQASTDKDKPNKDAIAAAKTAMEVISVCKYGMFTSKTMDKMKGEKASIFSDPNLSWNKNEIGRAFGKTADWTIDALFNVMGYGITFIGNTVNKTGSQIGKNRGALGGMHAAWKTNNEADKQAATQRRDDFDVQYTTDKAAREAEQRRTRITDIDAAQRRYDNAEKNIEKKQQKWEQAKDALKPLEQYQQLETAYNDLDAQFNTLETEINQVQADLTAIPLPYANAMDEGRARNLQARLNQLTQQQTDIDSQRRDYANQLANLTATTEYQHAATNRTNLENAELDAKNKYESAQNARTRLGDRIAKFRDAQARIEEMTAHKDRLEKIVNEWDDKHTSPYDELIQFWNYLESGRDSRFGDFYNRWRPSKKNAQKHFDQVKEAHFQAYMRNHALAA